MWLFTGDRSGDRQLRHTETAAVIAGTEVHFLCAQFPEPSLHHSLLCGIKMIGLVGYDCIFLLATNIEDLSFFK